MILAKVIGRIVSNQKSPELTGSKLLLVQKVDRYEQPLEDIHVAIDRVGAGTGDVVLIGEWSIPESRNIYQDNMSIIAIVEKIQNDERGEETCKNST